MDRIVSLQYLRAAAALAVLGFHAMESTNHRVIVGAAGVDLFFIISGFVMGLLLTDETARPGSFLWRRFVRIAPAYWAATAVTLVAWRIWPQFFPWMAPSVGDVLLSAAFVPYTPAQGEGPVLLQGWTLNYEAGFYVICALALAFATRARAAIVLAVIAALGLSSLIATAPGPLAHVYLNPLLLEFAAGLALSMAWRRRLLASTAFAVVALTAGGAGFLAALSAGVDPEGFARVAWWGLPALAVTAGALSLEGAGRLPTIPGAATMGDASYALYLLHVLPLQVSQVGPIVPATVRVPIAMAAAVVIALVAHHWVEKPVLAALRRLAPRPRAGAEPAYPRIANPIERQ